MECCANDYYFRVSCKTKPYYQFIVCLSVSHAFFSETVILIVTKFGCYYERPGMRKYRNMRYKMERLDAF